MLQNNLNTQQQPQSQPDKNKQKLPYRQPKVYALGSLEQVQGSTKGDIIDRSNSYYTYT